MGCRGILRLLEEETEQVEEDSALSFFGFSLQNLIPEVLMIKDN